MAVQIIDSDGESHVYLIYIGKKLIGRISGDEAAGEAYLDAEKLAEDFGLEAKLVDETTGENLTDTINTIMNTPDELLDRLSEEGINYEL